MRWKLSKVSKCVRTKVVTLKGIEASGKGKVIKVGVLTSGVYNISVL